MWSIFQIQDMLGMSEILRSKNIDEERINVPANPTHYWRYRMHITLEDLLKQKEFTNGINKMILDAGR
jgi:4-alpha-glucanotransferase